MRLKALRPDDVVTVRAEVIILMLLFIFRFKLYRGTVRTELNLRKGTVLTRFYSAMAQLVTVDPTAVVIRSMCRACGKHKTAVGAESFPIAPRKIPYIIRAV